MSLPPSGSLLTFNHPDDIALFNPSSAFGTLFYRMKTSLMNLLLYSIMSIEGILWLAIHVYRLVHHH